MAGELDLEAIRALCEAATPGPWRWAEPENEQETRRTYGGAKCEVITDELIAGSQWIAEAADLKGYRWRDPAAFEGERTADFSAFGIRRREDATFITAAREAIPALLALVETQVQRIKVLEARIDEIKAEGDDERWALEDAHGEHMESERD